jgi:Glycosyl transferase family 8
MIQAVNCSGKILVVSIISIIAMGLLAAIINETGWSKRTALHRHPNVSMPSDHFVDCLIPRNVTTILKAKPETRNAVHSSSANQTHSPPFLSLSSPSSTADAAAAVPFSVSLPPVPAPAADTLPRIFATMSDGNWVHVAIPHIYSARTRGRITEPYYLFVPTETKDMATFNPSKVITHAGYLECLQNKLKVTIAPLERVPRPPTVNGRSTQTDASWDKLRLWDMSHQFSKVAFFDADILFVHPTFEVLDFPDFSAAFSLRCDGQCNSRFDCSPERLGHGWCLNSGVMVLQPNKLVYEGLLKMAAQHRKSGWAYLEQELIENYWLVEAPDARFPHRPNVFHRMSEMYNVGCRDLCLCFPGQEYRRLGFGFKVLHYFCVRKPWHIIPAKPGSELRHSLNDTCTRHCFNTYIRTRDEAYTFCGIEPPLDQREQL